jgi:putative hydrolase of the HAD superfamily
VQLGIVSNAQFYTPLALTALLGEKWRSWFKPSLCFWSYEHREAKPGPELYQRALAALEKSCGIKPPEAVMIGNSIANDVRPALACGCRAVLFAGDRRACRLSPDDRRRISSRRWPVITGWPQLMKIIVPGP